MPSGFDAEFLADAAAEFAEEFGETAMHIPSDVSKAAYSFTGEFESPAGRRDADSPVEIHAERMDLVVLRTELQHTPQQGDRITRTSGPTTITYRVVSGDGRPENEAEDGGEIYRRLHLERTRT